MDLLVKNARIITGSEVFESSIGVQDGKIARISPNLQPSGAEVFNARGKIVVPGGIDAHTHMELPVTDTVSADDFYTGTVAAACGGITTIVDFVDPHPGETMAEAFADYRRRADSKVAVDYGLHMMFKGQSLGEIDRIPDLVSKGVPSFKVYTAYRKRGLMLDDPDIERVMKRVASVRGLVAVHAESEAIIQRLIRENLAAGNTAP
ncbi:MAG TPA: amidohydrolase family protein, partial [Nitrososphaerales archaeon]|nr:amidohydrolase family protein [Nitrososphaerales archaeon]